MKEGRWYALSLISLFFLALTLRLILPLEFNVWGPDTGENYYIANFFAVNGRMPVPYYGFGTTYTEFPTAYQLVASIANIAGISTAAAVALVTPFVTSLLVFPVAGITLRLTGKKAAGLLAGLFYATSVVIIGHTSILASDTLGEVVLLFFIYFYLSPRKDRITSAMAMTMGLSMVPTYHLGMVMVLLFLYSVLFYYSFFRREEGDHLLRAVAFILVLLTATYLYWMLEAPNFLSEFILRNPNLSIEEAISAPYLLAFMLFILGAFYHRSSRSVPPHPRLEIRKEYHIVVLLAGVIGVVFISIEGVASVPIYPSAYTLLNIPSVVCTLLGVAALMPLLKTERRGIPVVITIAALGTIVIVGVLTNIPYLVPERLVEYILLLIAVFSGIGMMMLIESTPKRMRMTGALVLGISLVAAGGLSTALVTATTTPSKIGATPAKDLSATQWLKWNTGAGATVASDHRLSSLLFGFSDRNATWELGSYPIFMATNISSMENALNNSVTPSGNKTVNYLFLDTYMIEDANFYPNQTAIPVPPEVVANLNADNFILVYSNGFAEVYAYSRG